MISFSSIFLEWITSKNTENIVLHTPFPSSCFSDIVGMWLAVDGLAISWRLGRSSFHSAIFSGRILNRSVKVEPSPIYSSWSVVNWSQASASGVGLLGFLVC